VSWAARRGHCGLGLAVQSLDERRKYPRRGAAQVRPRYTTARLRRNTGNATGVRPGTPLRDEQSVRGSPFLDSSSSVMSSLFERLRVVDSHLHLVTPAVSYRPAVEALLSSCTARLGKPPSEISERDFVEAAQAPYLKACVFVEVPRPSFRLLAHSLTLMMHGHQVRLAHVWGVPGVPDG
jgi:hypothetical protein